VTAWLKRAFTGARGWVAASCAAYVVMTLSLSTVAGVDDTHITFWAARALAHHGAILNYNGARIEQSSSLAMVVILAALGFVLRFVSIPMLGWLVSLSAGVGSVIVATRLARELEPRSARFVAPVVATSAGFTYWASSGMETSLAGLAYLLLPLAALRFIASPRAKRAAALVAALMLFVTVRPEAPIVLVCALVAFLGATAASFAWPHGRVAARPVLYRSLIVLGVAATVIGVVVGFRMAYFGHPVPRPVWAKSSGPVRWHEGASYFAVSVRSANPALIGAALAGVGLAAWRAVVGRVDAAAALTATLAFAGMSFVVASGGDWMPAGRFVAPLLPLSAVVAMGLARALEPSVVRGAGLLAVPLVAGNLIAATSFLEDAGNGLPISVAWGQYRRFRARVDPSGYSFMELGSGHLRDALVVQSLTPIIERMLTLRKEPIYMMSGQAGMVPYYAVAAAGGRARFIDMWSLTGDLLDACAPPGTHGELGVGISIDWFFAHAGDIERRCHVPKPDIVFSNGRSGALFAKLRRWGYTIAYTQSGSLGEIDRPLVPRRLGNIDYYVAVRTDVWKQLGLNSRSYDIREMR
jgi:hypothetical protein